MNPKIVVGLTGIIMFAIVSFTPVVPVTLHYYNIDNIFIIKAAIGMLCLLAGYIAIWGFFKSDKAKQKKSGKLHSRPLMLIVGVIIIALSWFTAVPMHLADLTGLSQTFEFGDDTLTGGIGTRIFTSALTAFGVLMIRFGFYRDQTIQRQTEAEYNQLLNSGRQEGNYD